jgi:hypothetical protein
VFLASKPPARRFLGLALKTQLKFRQEWEEARGIILKVASKQNKVMKELVAIGWIDLELDHFAPRLLSGSAKISKSVLRMCNSSINKIEVVPNQPSL